MTGCLILSGISALGAIGLPFVMRQGRRDLQARTQALAQLPEEILNGCEAQIRLLLHSALPDQEKQVLAAARAHAALPGLDLEHRSRLLLRLQRNGWIKGSGFIRLHGADLSGVDLRAADLTGINLAGCRLQQAKLAESNLSGANLQECQLAEADLSDAKLQSASLIGSNLTYAWLRRADLTGANLARADLRCADLWEAILDGTNTDGVKLYSDELAVAKASNARVPDTESCHETAQP